MVRSAQRNNQKAASKGKRQTHHDGLLPHTMHIPSSHPQSQMKMDTQAIGLMMVLAEALPLGSRPRLSREGWGLPDVEYLSDAIHSGFSSPPPFTKLSL